MMIKVEVIEEFTYERFDELKNITRANIVRNEYKHLYVGDTFECTEGIVDYLTKSNRFNKAYVKVIEVIPEEKPKKATTKK